MPKVVPGYKEQARARIIDAAAAVFARRGLPAGTMEQIAREIGVSKGALYLYFPTKSRLLEAVQARFRTQYMALLERRLRQGDVAEAIVDSIGGILTREFDPSVFHQLVMDAGSDPEVLAALRADARQDRLALQRLLGRLEEEGRIPRMTDPEGTADALLLLLQGTFAAVTLRANARESRAQLLRALRLVLGTPSPRSKAAGAVPPRKAGTTRGTRRTAGAAD